MNQDFKDYFFFVACQAIRVIFSAIAMALLARLLGPDGLGHWTMVVAAATMVHLFLINWIQQEPLVRFGKEEWVRTGSVVHAWNARLPVMAAGVAIALLMFFAVPQSWMQRFFVLYSADSFLAALFFIGMVISIETQTLFQVVGAMRRLAYLPVLVAAGTCVFYAGLHFRSDFSNRVTISMLGTGLITVFLWGGYGFLEFKRARLRFEWDGPLLLKEMVRFAWPILPTTLLGYLMNWGNQIIIQRYLLNRDVGYYQTAFQVHSIIVSIAVPFTTIILPKLIGRNVLDPTVTKRYVGSVTSTLFFLWSMALVPVIVFLPAVFKTVFGSQFSDSIPVLMALLIGSPFCALGQIYTALYSVQKKMGHILAILAFMVAFNLITARIVLPLEGILGMAYAFSMAFIIAQFLMFFVQHRIMREPVQKMILLFAVVLVLSVGQAFAASLLSRCLGGILALLLFALFSRKFNFVNGPLLDLLFVGRFSPVGSLMRRALVSSAGAVK